VLRVLHENAGHQNRGVEEIFHRNFPRLRRSRSSRTRTIVLRTTSAARGFPESKTQPPCFFRMRPFPWAGRRRLARLCPRLMWFAIYNANPAVDFRHRAFPAMASSRVDLSWERL
jgi:hypothetical protein